MGQVYVEISASVVNEMMGISTLNGSGAGGSEELGLYLQWNDYGFSGQGWYFDETPLKHWWSGVHSGGVVDEVKGNYSDDPSGFQAWIFAEDPDNLNAALGNWTNSGKLALISKYTTLLSCLSSLP